MPTTASFTFFGKGHYSEKAQKWVPSTKPQGTVDIAWTGAYIKSEKARYATEELRSIMPTATDQQLRDYKLREFDAVAGAGTFSYGNAKGLIERSKYIVLDIDDLEMEEFVDIDVPKTTKVATPMSYIKSIQKNEKTYNKAIKQKEVIELFEQEMLNA